MTDVKQFSHRATESWRKKQKLFSASLWLIIPLWDRGKKCQVNK
jgi:hypothetical protein